MLKRLIFVGFLILFYLIHLGQSVRWSEPTTLDGFSVSATFSTTDSTIYVIKRNSDRPTEVAFESFDKAVIKQNEGILSFDVNEINHITLFNDLIHVFGVKHHKDKDELITFQIDTLGQIASSKSLLTCASNGGYHATFDVRTSPKQSYCAIIGTDGYTPDQKEVIHTVLYDTLWDEHHHKEIITNILSQKRSFNAITVSEKGVTYILKRERKKSADKYYVYTIRGSGEENHHELHLKAYNIVDMKFDLDSSGNLYVGGFYAQPYKANFEGIYIKKINSEGTEIFSKEYMFNENVVNAFNSKKDIKDFGYGLRRFRTGYFGFVTEKDIILEAEHMTKEKDKNGNYTVIQNGFVRISLSDKGGFKYATPVSTLQTDDQYNGYWNSHCHVNYHGEDLIFINILGDGAKEVKEDLPENAFLYPYKITFNENGVAKRELLALESPLKEYAIYPDFKNQSRLPVIIVKSKDKDQYAVGLLTD